MIPRNIDAIIGSFIHSNALAVFSKPCLLMMLRVYATVICTGMVNVSDAH